MSGDEIFSADFRRAKIDEHLNWLKKEHNALMDYFDKTPDLEKKREILRRQTQILDAQMLFVLTKVHELELTGLKDALKELPSREEFNAVKAHVTKSEENVRSTLEPIKNIYDQYFAENKKRMEESGFIG